MNRKQVLAWAAGAAIAVSLLAPRAAISEGAFAVGSTGNVAKDGIAYGGAYNHRTREAAIAGAVEACRKFSGAPRAVKLCEVVATFKRECYASANDPKGGTPGTGWAVAPSKATAEARALAACRATAGAGRRDFCKVDQGNCDERE